MNPSLTESDRRAEYVKTMGPELGSLCHDLREESDWLQQKWSGFRELFGKGDERIELLNTVASNFFYLLHKLMFEDAMLHLCRLTDPATTRIRAGKRYVLRENLTVMGLADRIPDIALKIRVEMQARQVKKNCEFARELRNHRLVHTDLETFRNGSTRLQIFSKHIEDALGSMRALLSSIEQHYGHPPSMVAKDPWGAQSLIYHLENAVRVSRSGRPENRL